MEESKPTEGSTTGGNSPITLVSHFIPEGVVCVWKDNCLDEGMCCRNCKNNTGKKGHYEPDVKPVTNPFPPWKIFPYIGDPLRPNKLHYWCLYG